MIFLKFANKDLSGLKKPTAKPRLDALQSLWIRVPEKGALDNKRNAITPYNWTTTGVISPP